MSSSGRSPRAGRDGSNLRPATTSPERVHEIEAPSLDAGLRANVDNPFFRPLPPPEPDPFDLFAPAENLRGPRATVNTGESSSPSSAISSRGRSAFIPHEDTELTGVDIYGDPDPKLLTSKLDKTISKGHTARAARGQLSAFPAPRGEECGPCHNRYGPFETCRVFVANGEIGFHGACVNCSWGASNKRCPFRQAIDNGHCPAWIQDIVECQVKATNQPTESALTARFREVQDDASPSAAPAAIPSSGGHAKSPINVCSPLGSPEKPGLRRSHRVAKRPAPTTNPFEPRPKKFRPSAAERRMQGAQEGIDAAVRASEQEGSVSVGVENPPSPEQAAVAPSSHAKPAQQEPMILSSNDHEEVAAPERENTPDDAHSSEYLDVDAIDRGEDTHVNEGGDGEHEEGGGRGRASAREGAASRSRDDRDPTRPRRLTPTPNPVWYSSPIAATHVITAAREGDLPTVRRAARDLRHVRARLNFDLDRMDRFLAAEESLSGDNERVAPPAPNPFLTDDESLGDETLGGGFP
ncbi:hypothetical protein PENDEC_c003G01294 [Penicillium decumbens]|uniref:Uncharacterized protein n=1 Tax=Penicillium decumbens TaxID=69771 RepID=A0A1V6PJ69_PENDC|nr:hypothetical protein PENDEC_c003G01294 [Penicillium decumbens]